MAAEQLHLGLAGHGHGAARLRTLAQLQLANLAFLALLLLGDAALRGQKKARLTRRKGWILLCTYAVCVTFYILLGITGHDPHATAWPRSSGAR